MECIDELICQTVRVTQLGIGWGFLWPTEYIHVLHTLDMNSIRDLSNFNGHVPSAMVCDYKAISRLITNPGPFDSGTQQIPLVSSGANQVNCSQPCRFFVPPHCQLTQTPPDRGVQPMHSTAPQGAREVSLGRHAGFPRHLVESFFTNPAWSRGAAHGYRCDLGCTGNWFVPPYGGYCAATSTCHLHKPRLITGPGPGIPVHPTVSGKLVCVAMRGFSVTFLNRFHKPRLSTGTGPWIPLRPKVSRKLVCVAMQGFGAVFYEPLPQTPPDHRT